MPLIRFNEEEFLQIGLSLVGFGDARQKIVLSTKIQRFRDNFGTSPKACAQIFLDLQMEDIMVAPKIESLLMTLKYLKSYLKEGEMAGMFGKNERTIRHKCWEYAKALQSLKSSKVSFKSKQKRTIDY